MSVDLFLGECKRMEMALRKIYGIDIVTNYFTNNTLIWGNYNFLTNQIRINVGSIYNPKNDMIGRMRFIIIYSHEYMHSIFKFDSEAIFDKYMKDPNFVKLIETDCKIRTCSLLRDHRNDIIGKEPFCINTKVYSLLIETELKEALKFYSELYVIKDTIYDKYKVEIKELNKKENIYRILDQFKKEPIIDEINGYRKGVKQ